MVTYAIAKLTSSPNKEAPQWIPDLFNANFQMVVAHAAALQTEANGGCRYPTDFYISLGKGLIPVKRLI